MTACGDDTGEGGDASLPSTTAAAAIPTTIAPDDTLPTIPKPDVQIPADLPTELVVTDLVVGAGPEARVGDTVVVHYVGVRSADGTEFDNSYDRGTPFDVLLGSGGVIEGWDKGLVGSQAGGRRQLDIPADLAYGDSPRGDIIQPGDALSFVIDVLAVIPVVTEADEPQVTVEGAANVESFTSDDLVVGEGPQARSGQTVAVHIVAFRADTGEKLNSTWTSGRPFTFSFGSGQAILGLELAVNKMNVGGRRLVTIPFTLAFGETGSTDLGLPPSTDLVLLVDLVAAF